MAVAAGPDIVEDGLVLYYDLDNNIKSWKGEPTTNIISAQSISGFQNITYTYVGLEDGWKKYAISGTWSSGTYPWSCRIPNSTLTGGVAYSARFLVKINASARAKFATWPDTSGGVHYVNDPNMVSAGTKTSTSLGYDSDALEIFEVKNQGLTYSTGYANPTTIQPGYFHSRPLSDGTSFDSNTDFVWIKEVQTEQGSYCTPYVDGTRSTSQSILDISGQNQTVTISSLTYSEGNTPTFNGTSNYIDIPSDLGYTTTCSAFAWFKSAGSPSGGYHIVYGGQELEISIFNTGYLRTGVYQGSRFVSNHGSGLVDGNWHYVGFTFDGSTKLSYINGEFVGSQAVSAGSLTYNVSNRRIGRWGANSSYYCNGSINQPKIYSKALIAAEVKQNYIATKSRYGL